jgi:type I restriction enzyme S subunit
MNYASQRASAGATGWQTKPLGEVVKPTRPRIKPAERPDLPFVGMEHIEAHTMKLLGTVHASTMKSSAVHFQPGDVLYGRLRPYLNKVYRPDFEGLCSAEFIVFPKTDGLESRYLQYFLNTSAFVSFASHLNTGDRPRVDFDQVAPFPFPVAPPDQQKRIVAEIEKQFSRLDEAVANLNRVKTNLKRSKSAVLKAAVEGRLVETEAERAGREGRSYETGGELLRRILETRRRQWKGKSKYKEPAAPDTIGLPELPAGWTWCGFEQVSISDKHALKAGPFGSALKKEMYAKSGYKIYGQEQVISGDPAFGEYFIDEAKYRELESCAVKPGDLLVSLVGTAGKVLVLPATALAGIINPRLLKLSLNQVFIAPAYAANMLQSAWAKRYFKLQAHGGTMEILNLGIIKALPVPLPPLDEQHSVIAEIERRFSIIRETEGQMDANFQRAERLRQRILGNAFFGTIAGETHRILKHACGDV